MFNGLNDSMFICLNVLMTLFMEKYSPKEIEKKWQQKWEESGVYKNYSREKKFYTLDMFPYPSGAGLHVGHPKGYIATDVISRFKLMQGYSVLHPMGWDAFGLPAENYAIKMKIHPRESVRKNVETFKKQLEMFGFTYDWDREINTTDPEFYKWTQWIFLKLFEKGLAYQSDEPVNWCPSCKTVLANEDLEHGLCERCGSQVIQKRLRQWVLRMTNYADRLLYDLDSKDLEWEDAIVQQQKNWIGRSEGAQFEMKIKESEEKIEVYTTRLDTAFGITYAVVAPEHKIISDLKSKIINYAEVESYIIAAQNKTTLERTELQKEKTGVKLDGIEVINPFTNEPVPLFVADYVLGGYGTGAVMAVPAHDERDWEFAKKYELPIIEVISGGSISEAAFTSDGILVNSEEYDGLKSIEARKKMIVWLEEKGIGKKKVNYKMRDWVYSRQRYWGEPIPIIHCEKCGAVGVPEEQLPVTLPEVENYEPTGTGESPLAVISDWVNTQCPKCGGPGKRETNTMPQWGGSSWYYLRFIDPKNTTKLIDPELEKDWMPVDLYVGGAEHATRHLLYARFWHKFLYDIGVVTTTEPFKKLFHVGLIQGEDNRKMSKRWGNVVNPDQVIEQFGADSMRVYEMFMGPFSQNIAWSTNGVVGTRKFLEKVWKIQTIATSENQSSKKVQTLLHQTIKKVTEDIENFRFNTAISQMMILVNAMEKEVEISINDYKMLIAILSPFAPHIADELWQLFGNDSSIFSSQWPKYDEKSLMEEEVEMVVQINGKLRDRIFVAPDVTEDEAKETAIEGEKIKTFIDGKKIKKIIFVPGKLINIVIEE
jgi:leucyl-tRNA synthetase